MGTRTVLRLVLATRESKGKASVERRYYLSSLRTDAEQFARAVRGHWSVENQLHWVLDVVFGEDHSRPVRAMPPRTLPRPADFPQPVAAGQNLQAQRHLMMAAL